MAADDDRPRLTSLSHGAGCACKLSLDELTGILSGVSWPGHEDLLVGLGSGDDAAVYRQPDGRVLVATTDFFTPLVDDARDWGRIAATNAVSDVYAMGATPRFALNLVGWPRELDFDVLRQVLDGAVEVARGAGYVIAGGHSIDSAEPLFGQVVIGDAAEADILTNAGARPGEVLVLTKPLGTGIVTTALKRSAPLDGDDGGSGGSGHGGASGDSGSDEVLATAYRAAVTSMTRTNADAAGLARTHGVNAATDVTGFGLLGHLHRVATASGVAAEVDAATVPLLDGVEALLAAGHVPGGSQRNADQAARYLTGTPGVTDLLLLADAQTSGGLLLSCPPAGVEALLAGLDDTGHRAAAIGHVVDGPAGTITVTGR